MRLKQRRAALSLIRRKGRKMDVYTVRFLDLGGRSFYLKFASSGGGSREKFVA